MDDPRSELLTYFKKFDLPENHTETDGIDLDKFININRPDRQVFYIIRPSDLAILDFGGFDTALKHSKDKIDFNFIIRLIHPDDRILVFRLKKKVANFLFNYPKLEPFEHVFTLDYRMRKADGSYVRILNQSAVLQVDKDGKIYSIISVCSDIEHLKKGNKPCWRALGPGTEQIDPEIIEETPLLVENEIEMTNREIEILKMLTHGFKSKDIAQKLFISKNTVDTHRRKMLKKAKVHNSTELIHWGIMKGLV